MIKSLKVFLVGMPSCGKSTLGKIVSEKTNLKMIDLDEEIAKLENQSIKKIFELKGESYFIQKDVAEKFNIFINNI